MIRARRWVGGTLASLGVACLLVELLRYWIKGHPIHAWPVVIGAGLGFIGFYLLDARAAMGAGGFIEGFTIRVIGTIRNGRRLTDGVSVVTDVRPTLTDDDKGVG